MDTSNKNQVQVQYFVYKKVYVLSLSSSFLSYSTLFFHIMNVAFVFFVFQTTFLHIGGFFATNTITYALFHT